MTWCVLLAVFLLHPQKTSSQTLSRSVPRSEEIVVPVDPEFAAIAKSLKAAADNPPVASMDAFSASVMATDVSPRVQDHPKMLTKLQYSVFDLPESEEESACRSECVNRFVAAQRDLEDTVCEGILATAKGKIGSAPNGTEGAARDDGMTQESCAQGVDAGLYVGCQVWCDPRVGATHTTFRHDLIHGLANRTRQGHTLIKDTCREVQGRRVRIQLLEAKKARQGVETAACEFGFRGGFASVVITEQRLNGLDKLNLPIAFWEHSTMDNQRRRRFFYWWGGTDTKRRAEEECRVLYPDEPVWRENCATNMRKQWDAEAEAYYFPARDPSSQLGDAPLPIHDLPLLHQTVETATSDGKEVSRHVVVRHAEQTPAAAALAFCSRVGHLAKEPYLSRCREVMTRSLRIEIEAEDLADLKRMRLY